MAVNSRSDAADTSTAPRKNSHLVIIRLICINLHPIWAQVPLTALPGDVNRAPNTGQWSISVLHQHRVARAQALVLVDTARLFVGKHPVATVGSESSQPVSERLVFPHGHWLMRRPLDTGNGLCFGFRGLRLAPCMLIGRLWRGLIGTGRPRSIVTRGRLRCDNRWRNTTNPHTIPLIADRCRQLPAGAPAGLHRHIRRPHRPMSASMGDHASQRSPAE